MFLTALSAIAIALGSSMAVHDLGVDATQASQVTPAVEVAPVQAVDNTDGMGEPSR